MPKHEINPFDETIKRIKSTLDRMNELLTSFVGNQEVNLDEAKIDYIDDQLYTINEAVFDLEGFVLKQVPIYEDENGKAIDSSSLDELAALATEFDKSNDPKLRKQAAVLDEILLTIGASKRQVADVKSAQDREIERLKSLAKDEKDPYTMVKAEHDKQLKVEDARKQIANKVKEYRPMEAPLMTRTCPDHPGAQMARIAEHTYQCSMDKAVYNYQTGFTTMKGNKVPGSSVMNQTLDHDKPNEFTSFDSRESRLNK